MLGGRAVDRRPSRVHSCLQETGDEVVVVKRVLHAGLVERPGAGVEVRHLGLRLGVAGLEQLLGRRVAAHLGVVVEPDQGLQERVDDRGAGSERVLQKARARRVRTLTPAGGGLEKIGIARAGDLQVVGFLVA